MRIKFLVFLMALCVTACTALLPGEKYLQQGRAAYQRQDYHMAFLLLLNGAKSDNLDAQYAVGYMYYYGIGTKRDPYVAIKWFHQAARFGQSDAKQALYRINHSGPPAFTFGKSE